MEPVFEKKNLPENFQYIAKKDIENQGYYSWYQNVVVI
jgi:hypothetical protein